MEFETVIGLEVHIQLSTQSKAFCGASAAFGGEPNEHIDPLTFGLPGSLPVLNHKMVDYAIMLGLALNCEIRRENRFARKHYFYPDLPKGYQISQFEEPICERGHLEVRSSDSVRTIGITRVHMEEDAGKSIHDSRTKASLVDLNRAGIPLLEIVSEPDLRSPSEAADYLRAIRQIALYLQISDGNMEEGSLRCDANVSLRPKGQLAFGTRTEIKNLNSFKFVEKAIEYEVARQHALLKSGAEVVQETRLFDPEQGTTRPMRSKEESSDYRYFPDPDLPPLLIEERWIRTLHESMPPLPHQMMQLLVEEKGLSEYDAQVLTAERTSIDYFLAVESEIGDPKLVCNWITSELFGALKKAGKEIDQSPVTAPMLTELLKALKNQTINGKMAKDIFEDVFQSGKSPSQVIEEKNLSQITDRAQIVQIVESVLLEHPEQTRDYLEGNQRLHGFFVGQVMKATKGKANPLMVNEALDQAMAERGEQE